MKKLKTSVFSAVAFVVSLFVVAPFAFIIINSFKTKKEAADMSFAFPEVWNIVENYTEVIETGVVNAFKNSCIVTFSSVFLVIILSSVTAFVLQRRKSRLTEALSSYFVLGLIVPGQIIPTYILCSNLRLTEFVGASLVLTAASMPLAVYLYLSAMKSIPKEIDEAAFLDGCNSVGLFFRIILPLLKPMTVTVFIMTFMSVWNDFGTTIYFLNKSDNYTLPLTIYNFFSTHSSDWNLVFADVVIVSLPVIILYFCAQKQIMSGMTSGAVKG